jgi:hypothetical protein
MLRRTFVLGSAAAVLGGCETDQRAAHANSPLSASSSPDRRSASTSGSQSPRNQLVYLSARNCLVCPNFDFAHIKPYEKSAAAQRIPVRRVLVPNLQYSFVGAESYWPGDLQWLRNHFATMGARGTPWTMLIDHNSLVVGAFGGSGWRSQVEPSLRQILAVA